MKFLRKWIWVNCLLRHLTLSNFRSTMRKWIISADSRTLKIMKNFYMKFTNRLCNWQRPRPDLSVILPKKITTPSLASSGGGFIQLYEETSSNCIWKRWNLILIRPSLKSCKVGFLKLKSQISLLSFKTSKDKLLNKT